MFMIACFEMGASNLWCAFTAPLERRSCICMTIVATAFTTDFSLNIFWVLDWLPFAASRYPTRKCCWETQCTAFWQLGEWWKCKGDALCAFVCDCICQWQCVGVIVETLDCETALPLWTANQIIDSHSDQSEREQPDTCHRRGDCLVIGLCVFVPGVYRSTSTAWGAASSSEGLILCFSVSAVVLGTIMGTRDNTNHR